MNTSSLTAALDPFRRYRSVTDRTYEQIKGESRRELMGFTLGDVPREVIHAAGFHPVGIVGRSSQTIAGTETLPAFCCSLTRSALALGTSGALKSLAGFVLAHICDTTRDFAGIWQHHVKLPFYHDWLPPKQVNRPSARPFLLGELERLRRSLADFAGRSVSEDDLCGSIALYEEQRSLMDAVKRASRRGALGSLDLYTVLKAALFVDVEEHNRKTRDLLALLDAVPSPAVPKVPLVFSGKVPEPLDVVGLFEEFGGTAIDDDFLWASRVIRQRIPAEGTALERLAERLLVSEPFPGYLYETPARRDFLLGLIEGSGAAGVVFWDLKFCEPYNFDYPDLERFFRERGLPTLHLETDVQATGLEQLRTRVQAFLEGFTLEG